MHSSERKLRVLFVGAFPPEGRAIYGGVVSSCRSLVSSPISHHVQFSLFDTTQRSHPPPGLPYRLVLAAFRFVKFVVRLARERPDAALIFLSGGASLVDKGMMAWVAKGFGVRVLLFPRAGRVISFASQSRLTLAVVRLLLRPADVLLCQSLVWQRFACSKLNVPVSRTIVVENWTALPEFLAIGLRRPRDIPINFPVRVTFVGWVEREKGIYELLRAFGNVHCARGVNLQIVGDGKAMHAAREMAKELGIVDRVQFYGWLPRESLCRVLEESDIFVLPSWAEGLPNAMIEAMAARLPVIVSGVGAIPDVIKNRVNGFLVEPRSSEKLRAILQEVVNREDLRHAVADAGFELAQQRFSIATAEEKFRRGFMIAMGSPA